MSLLSDVREDMRLARLNNPGYGFLFRLIDVVSVLIKVTVLAVFGLGIWHIIYGLEAPGNTNRAQQNVSTLEHSKGTVPAAFIAEPHVGALSPERVEMLRQFAVANRDPVANEVEISEAGNAGSVASTGESMIAKVEIPKAILDQNSAAESGEPPAEIIIAGDIVPLPVDTLSPEVIDPLTLKSRSVFEALESKMQAALEGAGNDQVIDPSEPKTLPNSAVPTLPKDNDGLKDAGWILAQNPNHYTIQIGSTLNRPFLVAFARQLPKGEPISIYHYVFRDRPEYGLSYGLFDSIEAANTALEGLSQKARRYGAFPRKLSIVHQQIDQPSDQVAAAEK